MNFLRRYYLEREAKRLENEIQTSHEANDFLKIVPVLVELGDSEKAESFRREAVKRYPNIEFGELSGNTKPESNPAFNLSAEISKVVKEIEKSPNPWLYGRLARLLVNGGELERAEDTANKALRIFKEHPYPYTILAEIAILKNDKRKAISYFSKANQLDSQSAMSLTLMSQFYNEVKDFERTRKLLEQLLMPSKGGSPVPNSGNPEIEIEEIPVEVTKQEVQAIRKERQNPVTGQDSKAYELISQIRTLRYVQGVIVLDHKAKVLAADLPFSLNEGDVKNALTNLWQSSMSQSKQMALGSFEYTAFEGASGGFFIVQSPEYVVGLLFDKRRRLDQDQQELFEFCANLF